MPTCRKHPSIVFKQRCPLCNQDTLFTGGQLESEALVERMNALLSNPTSLNQDAFGVCGMSSVVYIFLKADPERMIELFYAVFGRFVGRGSACFTLPNGNLVRIDFSQMAMQYEDWDEAGGGLPRDGLAVDFFLSRALGQIIEMENRDLYLAQRDIFNLRFGGEPFTRGGNLALDVHAIMYLMTDLFAFSWVERWDLDDPTSDVERNDYCNAFLAELHGYSTAPTFFAIAGIFADLMNESTRITTASVHRQQNPNLPFNHWVVILDAIDQNTYWRLTIWTWGRNYTIEVAKSVIHTYITEVVHGQIAKP